MSAANVRPDKITLARESRGYTQSELAKRLNVSQSLVSKIEMGTHPVSEELLAKLCAVLKYTPALFFMTENVYGTGPSDLYHHRKRQSTSLKLMRKIYASISIKSIQIARLLKAVSFRSSIPRYPIEDQESIGATEIARMVRAAWHVPRGPIGDMTALAERNGMIVVPFHFETHLVDAITCAAQPGVPPIVFINTMMCRSRYRLTLAHELAHVVMHAIPNPEMEDQAQEFAAEFLMPAADIKADLHILSSRRTVPAYMQALSELKLIWRTSMLALHKRATALNVVSPSLAKSVWMHMAQLGYRRHGGGEPLESELPIETPKTLRELVSAHLRDLGFPLAGLAEGLGNLADEFRQFFMPAAVAHLRAV